jgi:hypothetical protein
MLLGPGCYLDPMTRELCCVSEALMITFHVNLDIGFVKGRQCPSWDMAFQNFRGNVQTRYFKRKGLFG